MSPEAPIGEDQKISECRFRARDRQVMLTLTDRLIVSGFNVDAKQDTPRVNTHPWIVIATPTRVWGEEELAEMQGAVLQGLDAKVDE